MKNEPECAIIRSGLTFVAALPDDIKGVKMRAIGADIWIVSENYPPLVLGEDGQLTQASMVAHD